VGALRVSVLHRFRCLRSRVGAASAKKAEDKTRREEKVNERRMLSVRGCVKVTSREDVMRKGVGVRRWIRKRACSWKVVRRGEGTRCLLCFGCWPKPPDASESDGRRCSGEWSERFQRRRHVSRPGDVTGVPTATAPSVTSCTVLFARFVEHLKILLKGSVVTLLDGALYTVK
jgi:hypothetical protein